MWKEIKNDFIDEIDGKTVVHIDAWKTNSPNEQGKVIAKVICVTEDGVKSIQVEYIDQKAKTHSGVQELINESTHYLVQKHI